MLPSHLVPAGALFHYVPSQVRTHLPPPLPQPPLSQRIVPYRYAISHAFTDNKINQHLIANKIGRRMVF